MSALGRYRGTGLALLLLLGSAGLWWWTRPPAPAADAPEAIFRFEKEEVVGVRVIRPDGTLAFERDGEGWRTVGARWRPNAAMIRRVTHQLHDLSARARVAESAGELDRYGLGPGAIRVELTLRGGRTLAFAVGDPNPTAVSWYLRPLPDGPVYVVKRAAVDYLRMERAAFREDRFAYFDPEGCTGIEARIGGRELVFARRPDGDWEMVAPVPMPVDPERVQRVIGAVASLRALDFVADQPEDRARWSLDRPDETIRIDRASGEPITLWLGAEVPGRDPPQRYVWRAEDDAVYAVRALFTRGLEIPLEDWRDPRVVGRRGWELRGAVVIRGEERVAIERSVDTWRWAEGAAIEGITPDRLARAAAELRGLDWQDPAPAGAFDPPWARLELDFGDEAPVRLELAAPVRAEGEGPGAGRQLVRRLPEGPAWTVSDELAGRIDDLLREHARLRERAAERHR